MKRVRDDMSALVETLAPDMTVQDAARRMKAGDVGFLPVVENGVVVGALTDRDVAVRLIAEGRDPSRTRVRDVMTREVACVGRDEPLEAAYALMKERRVRRLPVVDEQGRLAGLLTLSRVAREQGEDIAAEILKAVVARP